MAKSKTPQHPARPAKQYAEARATPKHDIGDIDFSQGLRASMNKAKQRHQNLVRSAHAHTAVASGKPMTGSGVVPERTVAARITRSVVRTGITPRGANLVESEPYSGEVSS